MSKTKLTLFTIVFSCLELVAQVNLSSPVSIIGFGEIVEEDHLYMRTMGSPSASFHAPDRVNIANPATLAQLKTTVFSGGIMARRSNISEGEDQSTVWSSNLTYFTLAFPLQNQINAIFNRRDPKLKLGMDLSLRPYSATGFDFVNTEELVFEGQVSEVEREFKGSGSTYIVSGGLGVKYEQLSVGITLGHLFGASDLNRTATFPTSDPGGGFSFETIESERKSFRAFAWNFGAVYDFVFGRVERADGSAGDPNKYLTLGLTYHPNWNLGVETDRTIIRQNLGVTSSSPADTLLSVLDTERNGKLPGRINFGATYAYKDRWRITANYRTDMWSEFRSGDDVETESVDNSFRISGGVAYIPNTNSISNYFDRVTYLIGGYFEKDPRLLNGNQLENYGIKLGASFPFIGQRQVSYVTLNFGLGRLSVPNGYTENYYSIGLGYSLTDNQWFIQRKYD